MEPGDYQDALSSKILHILQSVGLLGAEQKGTHDRPLMAQIMLNMSGMLDYSWLLSMSIIIT